jgi:hypothetical protein
LEKLSSLTISRDDKENSATASGKSKLLEEHGLCITLAAQFLSKHVGNSTPMGEASTVLSSQSHVKESQNGNSRNSRLSRAELK